MADNSAALKAYKDEEARQCQILVNAIDTAIRETGNQFEAASMNALCGALVSIQATILASIKDPRHRKELRKAMDRQLPVALAEALTKGYGHCQVVIIGGPRH